MLLPRRRLHIDCHTRRPLSSPSRTSFSSSGRPSPSSSSRRKPAAPASTPSSSPAPGYGKLEYWNDRYEKSKEDFDWYQTWATLKPIIGPMVPLGARVLVVGCGNSALSAQMDSEGYKDIVSIDYSPVVITKLKAQHPQLNWQTMDVTELSFPDASFDAAIDKGTLDAVVCAQDSTKLVEKMLTQIHRVLRPGGTFFEVSHAKGRHLQGPALLWSVEARTLPKPFDPKANHYVYICRKPK